MKKILIIVIPLLILAGGGYWYFTSKDSSGSKDGATSIIQKMQKEEKSSVSGSLKDIVGLGNSMKCTWEASDVDATSWIKGDKVYTEVSMPDANTNTIFVDGCVWSWSEGEATGIKMCYEFDEEEMEEDLEDMTESLKSYADSLEQQDIVESADDIKYNCSKTVISDSKFTPPSNVNFSTWEDLMQGSLEELEGMVPEDVDFSY